MRGLRRAAAGFVLLLLPACSGGATAGPGTAQPTATPTPTPSPSSTAPPLALEELGAFSSPVWVGPAPGDPAHLYLAERGGAVLTLDAQGQREGVLLDLGDEVSDGNEQGLLSIAFDPSYPRVPKVYVDYTDRNGDTRVVAYTVAGGRAVRPQLLLTVAQPYPNHNGGLLLFDRAGMLLVALGDGGNAGDPENRAQDPASFLGKLLRIDPRTGNPARGNPYPQNRYVWALGLRNPWRFSFDAQGVLYLGDAGQNRVEELDVVPPELQRGANYGWSVYEGDDRFKQDQQFTPGGPVVVPATTFAHDAGWCSITVGPVYTGRVLPSLRGALVLGDYCKGRLVAVRRSGRGVGPVVDLDVRAEGLQGFGVDHRGELLVLTVDRLSRLVPGA
ncbi:MAG TPA: PQQ-dependent sugar dehydrogenase [Mycobacteriales bacterium]|nr:PQQ-dependent sugar dehydrogenase [Mycobacteriales bacterium]